MRVQCSSQPSAKPVSQSVSLLPLCRCLAHFPHTVHTSTLTHRSYDTYDKYEAKDKYYGAAEDKYAYDKHAAEDKYAADKYEEKYNNAYEKHESYDKDSYGKDYGYGPAKVSIKLYEKYRSKLRIQTNNPNTFQFT